MFRFFLLKTSIFDLFLQKNVHPWRQTPHIRGQTGGQQHEGSSLLILRLILFDTTPFYEMKYGMIFNLWMLDGL